jgi:hypothetical protein
MNKRRRETKDKATKRGVVKKEWKIFKGGENERDIEAINESRKKDDYGKEYYTD